MREALDALSSKDPKANPASVRGAGLHSEAAPSPCLSTRNMASVLDVDTRGGLVCAQAGVTIASLRRVLRPEGLTLAHWGPLPQQATLGGLLGRAWPASPSWYRADALAACAGLQAITWDGTEYGYAPAPRKSSGPDLRGLFLSARGQHGVITAAHMAVVPTPEACVTVRALGAPVDLLDAMFTAIRGGAQPWRAHLWSASGQASLSMTFAGAAPLVQAAITLTRQALARAIDMTTTPDDADADANTNTHTHTLPGLPDDAAALALQDTLYSPWRAPSWARASGQGNASTLRVALSLAESAGVGVLITQPSPTDASALCAQLPDVAHATTPEAARAAHTAWRRLPWRWTLPFAAATAPTAADEAAPAWLRRWRATL